MYEVWMWNSFGRLRQWRTLTNSKLWLCASVNRNCLTTTGPFLERPETFRVHFRRHSPLCIFKTKASQGMKLCSYFNFSPLCNIWKDTSFTEWASRSFRNGFPGPKSFRDFRETGHRLSISLGSVRVICFLFSKKKILLRIRELISWLKHSSLRLQLDHCH